MALKDIIGQEQALKVLRGFIAKNRTAHAYIFTGEDGVGKKLTAINFAKTLNCQKTVTSYKLQVTSENPKSEIQNQTDYTLITPTLQHSISPIDCCDKCPSCIKINKLIHPDTLIISKNEDVLEKSFLMSHPDVILIIPYKGEIRVEVIRKLEEFLSYKAYEGKWKIVIIDGAETLNQASANAFLKTLEEPPAHSLLILISSMPEIIPATIRSRCQRVNFSSLPHNKMVELLEVKCELKGNKINSEQAKLLSTLSCGRPGWAMSDDLIEKRDNSFDKFIRLLNGIEEDPWDDRDSMEEWFEWTQLLLRDIAVFKATGNTSLMINQDRAEQIKNISRKSELRDILKLSDSLHNVKENLRFNLNEKLTLNYTYFLLNKTFGQ